MPFPDVRAVCVVRTPDESGGARVGLLLVAEGRLGDVGDRRGRGAGARPRRAGAPRRPRRRSAGDPRPRRRSRSTGLRDWLATGPEAPTDALDRLAVDAGRGLALLPAGDGDVGVASPEAGAALGGRVADRPRADRRRRRRVGAGRAPALHALVEVADASVIVVRGCYLALRRAVRLELTAARDRRRVRRRGRSGARRPRRRERSRHPGARDGLGARVRRRVRSTPVCCATRLPDALRPAGARGAAPDRRPRPRAGGVTTGSASIANRPLRDALHRRLLAAPFDPAAIGRAELRARLASLLHDEAPLVTDVAAAPRARRRSSTRSTASDRSQSLLADPAITEIMVNGPSRVFVERAGRLEPVELRARRRRDRADRRTRRRAARTAARPRVADGRRPAARRLPAARGAAAARARRSVPHDPALRDARRSTLADVRARRRCGRVLRDDGAGGLEHRRVGRDERGQDHLLRTRSPRAIDPSERVVTIEETAELRLAQPHVVRLEARPANAEGAGAVSVRELVRAVAADAARSARRRRGARRRGVRHAPGAQHRSRRFALDGPRELAGRRARPARDAGVARRRRAAAARRCARQIVVGGRRDRAGRARRGRCRDGRRCRRGRVPAARPAAELRDRCSPERWTARRGRRARPGAHDDSASISRRPGAAARPPRRGSRRRHRGARSRGSRVATAVADRLRPVHVGRKLPGACADRWRRRSTTPRVDADARAGDRVVAARDRDRGAGRLGPRRRQPACSARSRSSCRRSGCAPARPAPARARWSRRRFPTRWNGSGRSCARAGPSRRRSRASRPATASLAARRDAHRDARSPRCRALRRAARRGRASDARSASRSPRARSR